MDPDDNGKNITLLTSLLLDRPKTYESRAFQVGCIGNRHFVVVTHVAFRREEFGKGSGMDSELFEKHSLGHGGAVYVVLQVALQSLANDFWLDGLAKLIGRFPVWLEPVVVVMIGLFFFHVVVFFHDGVFIVHSHLVGFRIRFLLGRLGHFVLVLLLLQLVHPGLVVVTATIVA